MLDFCSHCGHGPLTLEQPQGDTRLRAVCKQCSIVHYQNPKIVCGCLPFYKDKVLLGRRGIELQQGYWNLPTGFMENGETLQAGAAREVREETGAEVVIEYLHTIYNITHVHQVYFLFLARLEQPIFEARDETLEVRLFDLDEIPWSELAFYSNIFALKQYIAQPTYAGVHHGDNEVYRALFAQDD